MPELPEVEITRRALIGPLAGQAVRAVVVRQPALRYPVPAGLDRELPGRKLVAIGRRAKYLLFDFAPGHLIVHLGMSGSLRLVRSDTPAGRHDHVDLLFDSGALRLHDPRRFGAVVWEPGRVEGNRLLASLGVEPLNDAFTGEWLFRATRGRAAPIKLLVMDSRIVVGVGNIYASESLFRAGIHPRTPAGKLSLRRCLRLAAAVRETLEEAIAAGGSSVRDYVHSDGKRGWFQQQHLVYGRAGEACRRCGRSVRVERLGNRSTFYCASCQR